MELLPQKRLRPPQRQVAASGLLCQDMQRGADYACALIF